MKRKRINNNIINSRVDIHIRINFDTWKVEVQNRNLNLNWMFEIWNKKETESIKEK
jgi:hypothetical protein